VAQWSQNAVGLQERRVSEDLEGKEVRRNVIESYEGARYSKGLQGADGKGKGEGDGGSSKAKRREAVAKSEAKGSSSKAKGMEAVAKRREGKQWQSEGKGGKVGQSEGRQ
jgi:hypothetical protein